MNYIQRTLIVSIFGIQLDEMWYMLKKNNMDMDALQNNIKLSIIFGNYENSAQKLWENIRILS